GCPRRSGVARRPDTAAQEGRTGLARVGDLISYETSHPVVFRADQPYESLVIRVPRHLLGRQEEEISKLTAVGIPGGEGLPKAAVAFFCGLVGRLEAGAVKAAGAPDTIEGGADLVRALHARSLLPGDAPPMVP